MCATWRRRFKTMDPEGTDSNSSFTSEYAVCCCFFQPFWLLPALVQITSWVDETNQNTATKVMLLVLERIFNWLELIFRRIPSKLPEVNKERRKRQQTTCRFCKSTESDNGETTVRDDCSPGYHILHRLHPPLLANYAFQKWSTNGWKIM